MIYFDNAATTPIDKNILKIYEKYSDYRNPSSLHRCGIEAKSALKAAREDIARILGAADNEIIFTSSGSESNNTVLFGIRYRKNSKIAVSAMEHSSVYYSAKELQNRGYNVSFIPCDQYGKVNKDKLLQVIDADTALVSIMHVNNETGGVNDIADLVKAVKAIAPKAVFHSDGVQAAGKFNINLHSLGVDCYSISGHKFNAPKGVGGLYVRKGVNIAPLIYGGGQEGGMRASTENVAGIIAMAEGLKSYIEKYDFNKICKLTEKLYDMLKTKIKELKINSNILENPNILSVALPDIRGQIVMNILSDYDVMISTGSACASNNVTNRIPRALGLDKRYEKGLLRFSLSTDNSEREVVKAIEAIGKALEFLQ